jgi:hypothetical protein
MSPLEAAMKTEHRDAAIAATVKELKSLVNHKTWRYLRRIEDRQESIHSEVVPSACILKGKKDSYGRLLLFKSRFCTVGNRIDAAQCDPFDKTPPTAGHELVCLLLAYASYYAYLRETFNVPSAYMKATLPDGERHVMQINHTVARILIDVDPDARRYLHEDGTILVELQRALYGLPEAGRLWHAFLTNVFKKAGYVHMPNEPSVWKRVHGEGDQREVSFLVIVVDDVLHIYNEKAARDHLYEVMRDEGILNVTVRPLLDDNPITQRCRVSGQVEEVKV